MTTELVLTDDLPEPRVIREPRPWVQMLGMMRMPYEFAASMASAPLLPTLRRGDGHPVLVMPGFMGGDSSTMPMLYHLSSWGYDVHGFGERPNPGPTPNVLARLSRRVVAIHERSGRTVSLIGWSAGGRYARHLAREHPDSVRQVITLAAGLQHRIGADRSSVSPIVNRIKHTWAPEFGIHPDHVHGPLPVPATSMYSRTDGVVRWHACLDVVDEHHENVEVYASHVGIAVNPAVLFVIADRLAQPEDRWRAFTAPLWLRHLYPPAPTWQPRPATSSCPRRRTITALVCRR
jgi:pimeloyl-ACP methyl ester carboxylesterase